MKTIVVAGFGPGISNAVAHRFGKEGFTVALVGRTGARLNDGVRTLASAGVEAQAFVADLSSADAARQVMARVKNELGSVDILHWNAYSSGAGDLTATDPKELRPVVEIATASLVAAIQEALPDLRANNGAILVTNGGFGLFDSAVDQMAATNGAMGLSIANAAKEKLVRLLHYKLKPQGVYVGEVMVTGLVKGSAYDRGNATLDPADIANAFWQLHKERKDLSVTL
jgi:NADP-dependent 3-hydroxy acid dehydrogenase YdfG